MAVGAIMYDVRAIANFFLCRAEQNCRSITVMTLLKILYFAHAWHLAKYDLPLIAQGFEAWKYGPVNRIVYDQLKHLGSNSINAKLKSFNPNIGQFEETPAIFHGALEEFLKNIFDYYSKFDAFQLSDLTHDQESPWSVVWKKAEKQAVPGMIIPDNLIKDWFAMDRRLVPLSKRGYHH